MARNGSKHHLDETDARKQNATANDVMREERFCCGRESTRENDLIVDQWLMYLWYSREPPQAQAIRSTRVV